MNRYKPQNGTLGATMQSNPKGQYIRVSELNDFVVSALDKLRRIEGTGFTVAGVHLLDELRDDLSRLATSEAQPMPETLWTADDWKRYRSQLADGCCSAQTPCDHQKRDPSTLCENCQMVRDMKDERNKPAQPANVKTYEQVFGFTPTTAVAAPAPRYAPETVNLARELLIAYMGGSRSYERDGKTIGISATVEMVFHAATEFYTAASETVDETEPKA